MSSLLQYVTERNAQAKPFRYDLENYQKRLPSIQCNLNYDRHSAN